MSNFSLDLTNFVKQLEADLPELTRKVALDLWGNIVRRTPVDTGRARGSWFVTVNGPSTRTRKKIKKGSVFATPSPPKLKPSTHFFITNNLPYINRLEYGYSQQAPTGMARVSLAETRAKLAMMVRKK